MKNSPYLVDQCKVDDLRRKRLEDKAWREKSYHDKLQLVSSMTGRASDRILTKENSRNLSPEVKLALGLRQSCRDEAVVAEEKKILHSMLQDELTTIATKFPTLPVLDQISRSGDNTSSSSTLDPSISTSAESSVRSDPSRRQKKLSVSPSRAALSRRSSHSRKTAKNKSIMSEGSSISGPLEYSSPNKRMQELQEQASADFSVSRFEKIDPPVETVPH